MKQQTIIGLCMLVILAGIVMACKESYLNSEDVVVYDIIETAGSGANCNISLYNSTNFISNRTMVIEGNKYTYNYSKNLSIETYRGIIECKKGSTTYLGGCNFVVERNKRMELAITIGLGILIAFLIVLTLAMKAIYLKILFGYGALGFTLLELNTIKLMAESNGMATNIISMLTTGYKSMMWITITLCFFGFIFGLQKLFMYLKDSMNKKNKRTLELQFR